MEAEPDNKVEDNTNDKWISDKDESVELVDNPFTLTEEVGKETAKIYLRSMQAHLLGAFLAKLDTDRTNGPS
eukprot:2940788-Ditylum_brightwellii.AAC.1